jgi:hypothetical protein
MATSINTGELIEQRRIAAGLTFWQLAHQLGLNADVVRHLSEGAQLDQLPLGTILRLCRLLTSASISFWRVADRRDLQNRQPTT